MKQIYKPKEGEYPPYAIVYLNQVPDDGKLLEYLKAGEKKVVEFFSERTEPELMNRYAPGKWTMKDILGHIIDDERVFAYRALRFARNDKTDLAGVDQDRDAEHAKANNRDINDLLEEYVSVRASSILLFNSFSNEALMRAGNASGYNVSVRALGYLIAGHELHHLNVLMDRYF